MFLLEFVAYGFRSYTPSLASAVARTGVSTAPPGTTSHLEHWRVHLVWFSFELEETSASLPLYSHSTRLVQLLKNVCTPKRKKNPAKCYYSRNNHQCKGRKGTNLRHRNEKVQESATFPRGAGHRPEIRRTGRSLQTSRVSRVRRCPSRPSSVFFLSHHVKQNKKREKIMRAVNTNAVRTEKTYIVPVEIESETTERLKS